MSLTISKKPGTIDADHTGFYLTDNAWTEAMNLGITVNELVSSRPTNPHVTKIWEILIQNHHLNWTTPDLVFQNTNVRDYFRYLVRFQCSNSFIEPKDFSSIKEIKLKSKL